MKITDSAGFFLAVIFCGMLGLPGELRADPPQSAPCPGGIIHHAMSPSDNRPSADHHSADSSIEKIADEQCSSCHGVNGISINDKIPNLAGQVPYYMCRWLAGCRKQGDKCEGHEDIAATLTDQQIIELSEFYGNLPAEQ